jgi:FtsH-binding integral membrane protein
MPQRYLVEQVMTWRARAYLSVAAARHLVLGLFMALDPSSFVGPAWDGLFDIAPYWLWTVALLLGGTHLSYSALRQSAGHARTALVISAAVSLMWAGAFGLVVLEGSASVLATVIFTAMALKDLIVCAQPLRSPFERLQWLYVET